MFALGLLSWMYNRPTEGTDRLPAGEVRQASRRSPTANVAAFRAGCNFGETTEAFAVSYEVKPAPLAAGHLPQHHRQPGAGVRADRRLAAGRAAAVPRAPTRSPRPRDILHELAKHKRFGVRTFQAEDEIAGIGAALGASLRRRARRDHHVRAGHRAEGRDDRAGGVAGAAAGDRATSSAAARRPACRPRPSSPTCCRRCSAATARRRCRWCAAQSPSDCFDTAIEAVADRADLPDAGRPALRRLPGQRLRAVAGPGRRRAAGPARSTSPREPERPGRRVPALPARPGDAGPAVGRARHARPGAPDRRHREGRRHRQRSPTTRPTTTSWSAPGRPRWTASPLAAAAGGGRPDRRRRGAGRSAGARRTGRSAPPAGGSARAGLSVAQAHLRHLNPLPADLGEVLRRYERVVVPEMNLGQLAMLLRARYLVDVIGYNQVRGHAVPRRRAGRGVQGRDRRC